MGNGVELVLMLGGSFVSGAVSAFALNKIQYMRVADRLTWLENAVSASLGMLAVLGEKQGAPGELVTLVKAMAVPSTSRV